MEAALKRQGTDGLLPNLIDALQAVESKVISGKNVVKKRLDAFDVRIGELSTDISALKENLTTQGGKLDKATTILESKQETNPVSSLQEQVLAQGMKLDKAIGIIEAQQGMIKTLLEEMQKGSSERKADLERIHSHFNTVVDRIAFLDQNAASHDVPLATPAAVGTHEYGQPIGEFTPAEPPVDVDVSMTDSHSLSDETSSVTKLNPFPIPSSLHSDSANTLGNGLSIPSSDTSPMNVAGTSASGWQQIALSQPVQIAASTTYVASYYTASGRYSVNENYFTASITNGPLTALASGVEGGNGVYRYGTGGGFPAQTFRASNYWVDVVFTASTTGAAATTTRTRFSPSSTAQPGRLAHSTSTARMPRPSSRSSGRTWPARQRSPPTRPVTTIS